MLIKEQIIAIGKKMLEEKLVASTWGNISVRFNNLVYATPSGMEYDSLKLEDIVGLDFLGNIVEGYRKPTTESSMHLQIYKSREDVGAIVHTHSLYASAYAVVRKEIPPLLEDMAQVVGGQVPVADYALPGSDELAENAVQALGDKGAVLLANHGLVGVGSNLQEAYKACVLVEKTAQIAIAAKIIGEPIKLADQDIQWMRDIYLTKYGQKA